MVHRSPNPGRVVVSLAKIDSLDRGQRSIQGDMTLQYSVHSLFAMLSLALSAIAGNPADAVAAALPYAQSKGALESPSLRFMYLGHLDVADRKEMWQIISGHVNGTSKSRAIYRPLVLLTPAKPTGPMEEADGLEIAKEDWARAIHIVVNLDLYKYDRKVIEKLALVNPHFHFREKKQRTIRVDLEKAEPQFHHPINRRRWIHDTSGKIIREEVSRDNGLTWETVNEKKKEEEKKKEDSDSPVHAPWLPAKAITDLALLTNSDSPVQYADWFWWQTAIQAEREPGPGYCDLLGYKNEKEFHDLLGFDQKLFEKQFKEFAKEYREAVGISGVSRQPRRIGLFDKIGGEITITYDNKLAIGDRNPLDTPDNTFKFRATEQLGNLPNDWLAMGLFNDDGTRQDTAPDFIGPDKTALGTDTRIHVGLCFRCHADGGLKDIDGWYKTQFSPPVKLNGPDKEKILDVQYKYFVRIDAKIKTARERFSAVVKEATGLTTEEYSKLISKHWFKIADAPMTMARAAREYGVSKEQFHAAMIDYKKKPDRAYTVLDMFMQPEEKQKPFPVEQFWEIYTEGQKILAATLPKQGEKK